MRTWKWMLTASLLISLSAMAQQTTAPALVIRDTYAAGAAAPSQPGCRRRFQPRRRRASQPGAASGAQPCRPHHHGPGG